MSGAAAGAALATLAFAVYILGRYFGGVAGPALHAALLLALACAAAAGAGRAALKRSGLRSDDEAELSLAGLTLGLGFLALGALFLAAAGAFKPWAASLLLGILLLAGYGELKRVGAWLASLPRKPGLLSGALILLLAATFVMTWAPPHQYDALTYHLALPQAYAQAGRLHKVENIIYTHFPQNAEMLFGLGLLFDSDALAQMFMWLATALSAGWLWLFGGRLLGASRAGLACILLLTHTAVMLLAPICYVEPLVMLWVTAAALSFWAWEREPARGAPWIALSGVFCGLALGTKYSAGICAALLAARLGWLAARRDNRHGKDLAVFFVATALPFAPWMIKNALYVKNPVFPFLYKLFPLADVAWDAQTADRYFHVLTEYGHHEGLLKDLLLLPTLLLRNDLRFGGGMDVLGDVGWDLSLWCLPLALWAGRRDKALDWPLAFTWSYLALWFVTGVILRFLTCLAPLLCLLAAATLRFLWDRAAKPVRAALGLAVALLTITHLGLFFSVQDVFGTQRAVLGLESREEFLSRRLAYYPCAAWARANLPRNDKILIVGEQRNYYVEQPHEATSVHVPNRFVRWANEAAGPDHLADKLKDEGFSHLLWVPSEGRRMSADWALFTERGKKTWDGFWSRRLGLSHQGPGCSVWTLKP